MQSELNEPGGDSLWQQLAPHLEAAMARLGESDRTLLALRFFEKKTGAEAAALLGIREEAAHKRTARALEKLHRYFSRLGISSTTAIIASAMSANSMQAAPAALAKVVTAAAVTKGATASTSTITLIKGTLKIMAYKKTTMIGAGIITILLIGTAVSISPIRHTITDHMAQTLGHLTGQDQKNAMMQQALNMKLSVWPALMEYSKKHDGQFPKSMEELRPYLPAGLQNMDDDHWRITAGNTTAKPATPELLTFFEQINQPAGKPRLILYADGHVEYRK